MSLTPQQQIEVDALNKASAAILDLFNTPDSKGLVFDSPVLGSAQGTGDAHIYKLKIPSSTAAGAIKHAIEVVGELSKESVEVRKVAPTIVSLLKKLSKSLAGAAPGDNIPATSDRHALTNSAREISRLRRFIADPDNFQYI